MLNITARNYRQSYIKLLKLCDYPLPTDLENYDVHHLDCDRKNNGVPNLVLIKKELHTTYHYLKDWVGGLDGMKTPHIAKVASDLIYYTEQHFILHNALSKVGCNEGLYAEMCARINKNEQLRFEAESTHRYLIESKPKWEAIKKEVLIAKKFQSKFHK